MNRVCGEGRYRATLFSTLVLITSCAPLGGRHTQQVGGTAPSGRLRLSAADGWSVVSTKNFALYTDGDVEKAKPVLELMETFRTFVIARTSARLQPNVPPLRLIAPVKLSAYPTLEPQHEDQVGYYRPTLNGPVAVFPLRRSRRFNAIRVALHEYVHHLTFQSGFIPMPLWYSEGIAEYLSAVEVKRSGELVVGGLQPAHLQTLHNSGAANYAQLILDPGSINEELLYPQSWLLVHFLANEHAEGLSRYLYKYQEPATPQHFEAAFGFPLETLNERVEAYGRRRRIRAALYPPPKQALEFRVERIDAAERDYLLAHLGVGKMSTDALRAMLERAPPGALPRLALAEQLFWTDNRPNAALAVLAPLLEQSPDDPRLLSLKARALVQSVAVNEAPEADREARLEEGVRIARVMYDHAPADAGASALFAEIGMQTDRISPQDIREALATAMRTAPHRVDLLIIAAELQANHGNQINACQLASLARGRTTNAQLRTAADALMALCQSN